MAAYALARCSVPLTRTLLMLVLMTQMFPLVVLVIPLFVLMRKARAARHLLGLVVTYLAFTRAAGDLDHARLHRCRSPRSSSTRR